MSAIADHLAAIRARLGQAELIAVSKLQDTAKIEQALQAGQRKFGENRVQEAREKFPALRARYTDIELHLIGPLQTNKARDAVDLFDVIQTLDRPALVDALVKAMEKTGHAPRFYIEVNIGAEPQKAGVAPDEAGHFLSYCRGKNLNVTGLMCIPPQTLDPRPFFMQMRQMADQYALPHLSMGMSGDYETAIDCGATEVRIGTALFGSR